MITLIIVDEQNDFITGTLAVKGAKTAVEETKKFIKSHHKEIEKIIFTVDWHPYNHSSFKRYGGQWPHHCVQYTPGACIFSEISRGGDRLFGEKLYLDIIEANPESTFVVCGIAGDYCVKETIKNLINGEVTPKVFFPGIASIDGGKALSDFVKENGLEKIV